MEETTQNGQERKLVLEGFERLAFGSVTDAVRLLFCEDINPRVLNQLDLFNVAEIKRPRGGGMEIRFFDRLRALQCLQEICEEGGMHTQEFYRVLEQSARQLPREESA